MARSLGHTGHRWRKVRLEILAVSTVCWICKQEGATSVDHVVPVSLGGRPLDPANLRPAHISCNSRRGNGKRVMATSRQW